jgi:hypothetical protein
VAPSATHVGTEMTSASWQPGRSMRRPIFAILLSLGVISALGPAASPTAAASLPKGFTTFRNDPTKVGQVVRDRCGAYTIVRTGTKAPYGQVYARITLRNAAGKVVWDRKKPPVGGELSSLGWCGDLLRDGSRVLELTVDSGDIWADTRLIWLGSRAIDLLDDDQWPTPLALTPGAPFALRSTDIRLAALSDANDRLIIPVSDTVPLPRVYVWRDLRYVDDTQNQKQILRDWRTSQVHAMGPASTTAQPDDQLAPGRSAFLVPIAIVSLWLGDWNTVGPTLGMSKEEKIAVARLLPVAFDRLGMWVGGDVPADSYLVDPKTIPTV